MDDNQFDQFLKSKKTPISVPASFQREVWQRIEAANESMTESVTPWQWLNQVIALMTRSLGSAACVAAMIVAGIWLGTLGTNPAEAAKTAYMDSINPLSQSLHHR